MSDYNIQERVDLFVEVGSVQAGWLAACEGSCYIPCSMLLAMKCCLQHAACDQVLLAGWMQDCSFCVRLASPLPGIHGCCSERCSQGSSCAQCSTWA